MTDIKELFTDLVSEAGPPSRLTADEVYHGGLRRRRRRLLSVVAGAAGIVAALTVGLTLVRPTASSAPADEPTPDSVSHAFLDGVRWIETVDGDHLYAQESRCFPNGCARLLGSDDGGRTWTVRDTLRDDARVNGIFHEVSVVGPTSLIRRELTLPDPSYSKPVGDWTLSSDGGRTWMKVSVAQGKATAIPDGHAAVCLSDTFEDEISRSVTGCTAGSLDPATRRLTELANKPPMRIDTLTQLVGGMLIALGSSPRVGDGAVAAASVDGGKTWTSRVFPCVGAEVVAARLEATTAYVSSTSAGGCDRVELVQFTADGKVKEFPVPALPTVERRVMTLYVDKNHQLLLDHIYAYDGPRFFEPEGEGWQAAKVNLPNAWMIHVAPNGTYHAFSINDRGAVRRSDDARTWTKYKLPN